WNGDVRTNHFAYGESQQGADHGAGRDEDGHEHKPGLRRRHFQICCQQGGETRRCRNRDTHPAQISEDRRQAAQEARHETQHDGSEQADIDGKIEQVGREEVHYSWSEAHYDLCVSRAEGDRTWRSQSQATALRMATIWRKITSCPQISVSAAPAATSHRISSGQALLRAPRASQGPATIPMRRQDRASGIGWS